MARADVTTLIPLDRAAYVLGIDPAHFNGIVTLRRPNNNACDDFWSQFAWQHTGRASREDLAVALRQAEDLVITLLGFSPVPMWVESEEKIVQKPYAVELTNLRSLNSRMQYKSIRANLGYVIEAGLKTKALIQASAAIVYSDADGDGYNELATVSVATTVTSTEQIHVYFPGEAGDDRWEIRPIDVSIAGGTATITFSRFLVPLPDLWIQDPPESDPVWRDIDGDVIGNFLTVVDVYRVYTDPSQHATFYHEDSCTSCGGSGCAACAFDTQTACLKIRDSRLGLLAYTPATWNATTLEYDYSSDTCLNDPDKILINYRAGLINRREKHPYWDLEPQWERAIVFYAYTTLDRHDSRCQNTHNIWLNMSEDLSKVQQDHSYILSPEDLRSPFGTTRAGLNLWRLIQRHRLV